MKIKLTAILLLLISAIIYLPLQCSAAAPSAVESLVNDNALFACDLYRNLSTQDGNIFFSPYSISTALAMAYAGARGNTDTEMARALHFSLSQEQLHPAFAQLASRLKEAQEKGTIKLSVANSLWPQQGYKLLPDFLSLIKKYYDNTITPVDYKLNPEAARELINNWVRDKTQDKIRNIISSLSPDTRLILVNAIYFKGNWRQPFKPDQTKDTPFFVTPESKVQMPMMHQGWSFKYAENESLQILELTYAGKDSSNAAPPTIEGCTGDLSMIVLLPKETHGLKKLEAQLSGENLKQWRSKLSLRPVILYLPKFKMTSGFSMGKTLKALGMVDAFSKEKANFSGIDSRSCIDRSQIEDSDVCLYISAVIHKAFVDVNEEGTEAAAATAIKTDAVSVNKPPPPVIFRADHPFIFLIQENKTGSILFMGRVKDPTKAGE